MSAATLCSAQTAYWGYTFFASGKNAYLYDMNKNLVHTWASSHTVSSNAVLLRDSSIYFPSQYSNGWTGGGILLGGRFERIKWDGTVSWTFTYAGSSYCPHHNFEAVYYTNDPKETPSILAVCYTSKGDKVVEIKPTGATTADIVWEWVASQHTGAGNPALLDTSKGGAGGATYGVEWMHTNFVSLHHALNQVVICAKSFNEVLVIDHSTTTAEAATHGGGIYGKGGDILYRWGNPSNYGVTASAQLNGQHSGCWVVDTFPGTSDTLPGRRNILIVNNGNDSVMEITPAGAGDGIYPYTAGTAFAPAGASYKRYFNFETNEGSVQRLPNGNTLLCSGKVSMGGDSVNCRILEVSAKGDSVWGFNAASGTTRATRYAFSYLNGNSAAIKTDYAYSSKPPARIIVNSTKGRASIRFYGGVQDARLSLFSLDGRELSRSANMTEGSVWDAGDLPRGLYLVKISAGNGVSLKRLSIRP